MVCFSIFKREQGIKLIEIAQVFWPNNGFNFIDKEVVIFLVMLFLNVLMNILQKVKRLVQRSLPDDRLETDSQCGYCELCRSWCLQENEDSGKNFKLIITYRKSKSACFSLISRRV